MLYAGYIESPAWGVSLRKARHEPLISWETFEKIQGRMTDGGYAPARKDTSDDFILRGLISCSCCGRALTGGNSRSKTGKRHAYYRCNQKTCPRYGKSIRRDKVETEFADIVASLQPAPALFAAAKAMFKKAWERQAGSESQIVEALRESITTTDRQIQQLLKRIVETDNPTVVGAYESKIGELERSRLLATEKLANAGKPQRSFGEMFELAMCFIANPWNLWQSGDLQLPRTVLKLAFTDRILYDRDKGFLNPKKAFPFKLLEEKSMSMKEMVLLVRFELTASPLPRADPGV